MEPVFTWNRNCLWAIVMLLIVACSLQAHDKYVASRGSFYRHQPVSEYGNTVKGKMATSAYPVHLKVQGRAVCVRSGYNQVIPVYTQKGAFYAMFRLTKGINWINGLPRGVYYINNRKITIL